jgi:hypothetical protein
MSHAAGPLSLGLGVKLMANNWKGENKNSDIEFESTEGGQFGFNAVLQKGKFYAGLNLQGGDYTFEDDLPEAVAAKEPVATDKVTIERGEWDILMGYYFWPRVSLFLDLKAIGTNWKKYDYSLTFWGPGLGASGFIPLNRNWLLFGSLGIVPIGNLEVDNNSVGDGTSAAFEFGAAYHFNRRNRINFGIKTQSQNYKFDSGEEQQHQVNSLFLGYNHLFLF